LIKTEHFQVVISLSMSGSFSFVRNHKKNKVVFELENSEGQHAMFYFDDFRSLGSIYVCPGTAEPCEKLGIDILDAMIKGEKIPRDKWKTKFQNRADLYSKEIASIITDQDIICGIGNYLKNDILYKARIHPKSLFHALDEQDHDNLYEACHEVIYASYLAGGHIENASGFAYPNSDRKPTYETLIYGKNITKEGFNVTIVAPKSGHQKLYVAQDVQPIKGWIPQPNNTSFPDVSFNCLSDQYIKGSVETIVYMVLNDILRLMGGQMVPYSDLNEFFDIFYNLKNDLTTKLNQGLLSADIYNGQLNVYLSQMMQSIAGRYNIDGNRLLNDCSNYSF